MKSLRWCGFILVIGLSGCATAPKSKVNELDLKIPDYWAAATAGRPVADTDWVSSFRDRKLNHVVQEALANNKDIKATVARLDMAQANARLAGADRLPSLEAGLSGARQKQNFIGFPGLGAGPTEGMAPMESSETDITTSTSTQFGLALDFTWEIDLWGRLRTARSAAIADFQAANADFHSLELSLVGQVAKLWFALREADEQVALQTEALKAFNDTEETIRNQFELAVDPGLAPQLYLAEADIANGKASLAQARESRTRLARQLEILLGRYPKGTVEISGRLPAMPRKPPTGVPSDLLLRRPDLLAAERRFAASDKRVREAFLTAFPRIALTASGGTSTEDLKEILNSDFSVWSLAGNIVQPIFQAGKIKAGYDLRKAENREALANYQQAALSAFNEVETALSTDRFLGQRETHLADAAERYHDAYTNALEDYRERGLGDTLTIFSAQQQWIRARSQYITIRRTRLENRVDLHLALGGDFRARKTAAGTPNQQLEKKK